MIGKVIYHVLTTDTDINAVIGNRVYPNVLPIKVDTPAIVYTIASSEPLKQKQGQSTKVTASVNVKCMHANYASVTALAADVREALDRLSGTIQSVEVDECYYDGQGDVYDPDNELNQKILTFNFSYKY